MGRSSSASTTTQTTTNTQDIDTTQVSAEGEGNLVLNAGAGINFAPTDLGAVDHAFDFAESIGGSALQTLGQQSTQTQKTLADAITKVSDGTRSHTSQTMRRLGLYAAIAVAVIFVAMQFKRG